jgi:putative tryptophan/tyrosine transport system substrate-binding protein
MIGRRTILAGLASAAFGRAAAQQRVPVVGFLNSQSQAGWEHFVEAFRQGLAEGGYSADRVEIEFRWAGSQAARLPALAAELTVRPVDVIVATGGPDPALAAKAATTSIPVVFTTGADPVALGLVQSLARPGGNVTGFTLFTRQLNPKRLEFLRELVPDAATVAVIFNPENSGSPGQLAVVGETAAKLGLGIRPIPMPRVEGFDAAFAAAGSAGAAAVLAASDPLFFANRRAMVAAAAAHRLPAVYEAREFCDVGGLMSYGVSFADVYRRAGVYAARILNGERPADLPVQQPSKFELVVNAKVAREIGLSLPPAFLARADEVIE